MQTKITQHESPLARFVTADKSLRMQGLNIVDVLTKRKNGHQAITSNEHIHYPEDDVLDSSTGAQYFLHRHESAGVGETVHLHIFKRWKPQEPKLKEQDSVLTHLAALTLDLQGNPKQWIAVNQWVVADFWQPYDVTVEIFRGWKIETPDSNRGDDISQLSHEWLSSLIALQLDTEIKDLLMARDLKLDQMIDESPGVNVLEDQTVEVLSIKDIEIWN